MAELQNEFSWSKSRHEKFQECRRAYWYTYYGSWGGWEAKNGTAVRELYVLKKLSTRHQWAGSVVHEALKTMLVRARARDDFWPADRVVAMARERARAQWSLSRDKAYWRESSKIVGLVEHEYGEVVPNEEWKRLYDQVIEGSLRSLFASPVLEAIRATPRADWLTIDDLDSWSFEGTKIWLAVDFAWRDADGTVHLLDWKTGREREVDHVQVGTYALYGAAKWKVAPEAIRGALVYLGGEGGVANRVEVAADAAALEACRGEMRTSIAAMKAALADPARNAARAEDFPPIEDSAGCRRCPYRRPCGRL